MLKPGDVFVLKAPNGMYAAVRVIRKVAKRILGGPDMIVVEAGSGLEALEMCMADMPDIIVVDGALPDVAAVDLIRRVRAMESPIRPQILISLVELDIASIMRAKRAGAQGYLLKPFNRPMSFTS